MQLFSVSICYWYQQSCTQGDSYSVLWTNLLTAHLSSLWLFLSARKYANIYRDILTLWFSSYTEHVQNTHQWTWQICQCLLCSWRKGNARTSSCVTFWACSLMQTHQENVSWQFDLSQTITPYSWSIRRVFLTKIIWEPADQISKIKLLKWQLIFFFW